MSKLVFNLSPYTQQKFKVKCIENGKTMRSILEHLVEFYIGEVEIYKNVDQDGTLEAKLRNAENVKSFEQRRESTEYLINMTDGEGCVIDYGSILFFKDSNLVNVTRETFFERKSRLDDLKPQN